MRSALVGYTGFVGGNLMRQTSFTDLYHSRNSNDMEGETFDLVVCSAARAEKWKANQDPASDADHIQSLIRTLSKVKAREAVVISTVDVFSTPIGVDETTEIDTSTQHPYGKHRHQLEEFCLQHFPICLVVRLPGLFGMGLKKNAVFDILHDNQVEKIHPQSKFQFYSLDNLWKDIQISRTHGLRLIHFATEPVSMDRVAKEGLEKPLVHKPMGAPVNYDFRSRYCALWNRNDGYLYSSDQTIQGLRAFK